MTGLARITIGGVISMSKQGDARKAGPKRFHIPADVAARKDKVTADAIRASVRKQNGTDKKKR